MARFSSLISLLLAPLVVLAAPVDNTVSADNAVNFGASAMVKALLSNSEATGIIPNRYIVVYNETYDDDAINAKEAFFMAKIHKRNLSKRGMGGRPLSLKMHSWRPGGTWRGMGIEADDDMIQEIYNSDEVAYVEADTKVHTTADFIAQVNAPSGLDRISHSEPNTESYVFSATAGENFTAYVVDTGIRISHQEFEGRATYGKNFVDDDADPDDDNGHGSHVAGTIGGATYGVAKKINLIAVKVLAKDGSGANSAVIDGLHWVASDVKARGLSKKVVVNLSLGGGNSTALDNMIKSMAGSGIVPVVAAGNDAKDACTSSPASAHAAITVGAIDAKDDSLASFSNIGKCVDIFAPGVNILSVGITSDTATAVMEGTSMACPHVTGLSAYLMSLEGITSASEISARIKTLAQASKGKVVNNAANTTNLIANNGNH